MVKKSTLPKYQIQGVFDFCKTGLQIINHVDVLEHSACSLRANGMEIMDTMDSMDSFMVELWTRWTQWTL